MIERLERLLWRMFADDTALISTHRNHTIAQEALQQSVSAAADWLSSWHLLVNASKTVVMSFVPNHNISISLNGVTLEMVHQHRHLGLIVQSDLRWSSPIKTKLTKARQALHQLFRLRGTISATALCTVYRTYIRPMVEYGSLALSNLSSTQTDQLERLQRRAARICLRLPLFQPTHHSALLHRLELHTMSSRRVYRQAVFGHSLTFGNVPTHLQSPGLYRKVTRPARNLRRERMFQLPVTRTSRHRDSPINMASYQFNCLPDPIKQISSTNQFKQAIGPLLLSSICSCSQHPHLA